MVYWWLDPTAVPPTLCPNNSAHVINPNSISIVNQTTSNQVVIKESNDPTIGGNFRSTGFSITAAPSVTNTLTVSWPWKVCLFTACFNTSEDLLGDTLQADLAPNTAIGTLTTDCVIGSTILAVSVSVIANVNVGYLISLSDGTNTDKLGGVLAIDRVNNQLTVQTATVHAFAAVTPTLVQQTVRFVDNFVIGHAGENRLGGTMIGGAALPANTPLVITYTNASAVNPHTISGFFDHRY